MTVGTTVRWCAAVLLGFLASCNGGGGGGSSGSSVTGVVQDLTLDPDGMTTVVHFAKMPGSVGPANFDSDGTQSAVSATPSGTDVVVLWDDRVTPSDRVRAVGLSGVSSAFVDVTTNDASVPSFTITDATQGVGLGNDTITVQFAGPRVVESEAELAAHWKLEVEGTAMDLTGSTFSLVPATQVLTITTGTMANLHADFELSAVALHSVADVQMGTGAVIGAASGDTTAPALASVMQNLGQDEFGRVIDVTFNEAMDPVFATALPNFVVGSPDLATEVEQPSANVLRVTFNNPMVPGVDSIQLTNIVDAHGNAFPTGLSAITAGSTVANGFASGPDLVTVENAGGDYLTMEFDQALDPDGASDATSWKLQLDPPLGAVVDLSGATFTYDLSAKSLVVDLVDDYANGQAFSFGPNIATPPIDVDGEVFASSLTATASGDGTLPTVVSARQNRTQDTTGLTVDVLLSEDVDQASAENVANWSATGANVSSATRLAGFDTVRLVLDALALPGVATLGTSGVKDIAGNPIAAVAGLAITSTDTTAPAASAAAASAVEGTSNDTIVVTFNDDMVATDVVDELDWHVESPVGTPRSTSLATVAYNAASRAATLTFEDIAGPDLQGGQGFQVSFTGMRDIAGNTITAATRTGSVVAESNLPGVDSVWVETAFASHVHVRFDEPCDLMDDIAGLSIFTVRNNLGVSKGTPTSAVEDADRMGVELVYSFAVIAGSDTLDVSGVLDLAGNAMFPSLLTPVEVEDPSELALDQPNTVVTTVVGEENDELTVAFDRRPSPWGLLDAANWELFQSSNPVDLSDATFSFDGNLTVTIRLDGIGAPSIPTGASCDVFVDHLKTAQGVPMSLFSLATVNAVGDSTAPDLPASRARIDAADPTDSIVLEMDEAIDSTDASDVLKVLLNGTTNPDSAVQLGQRVVRATFSGGVIVGDTVQVDFRDLAGNVGIVTRAVTSQDVAAPLVTSVAGVSVPGAGGDTVTITFNEPVEPSSALTPGNYTVTNGSAISLAGSTLRYTSATNRATIELAAGSELDPGVALNVGVANVLDHSGLAMSPPASVGGAVTGDTTAPDFDAAFANRRQSATATVIDVRFDEDVDSTFATTPANWVVSGGQTVSAVTSLRLDLYRITLSAPLIAGQTLTLVGVPDLAGNLSGSVAVQPTL